MPTHDVLHYGAVGDDLHNDAPAIQAAIGITVDGATEVTLRHVQVQWGPHGHTAFGQALFSQRAAGLTLDNLTGVDTRPMDVHA